MDRDYVRHALGSSAATFLVYTSQAERFSGLGATCCVPINPGDFIPVGRRMDEKPKNKEKERKPKTRPNRAIDI